MKRLWSTLSTEILKMFRSKIFWITILAFSFITIILALMMFILKNPEFARNNGLLGAKAQLIGEANWSSYFNILAQVIAMGGLIGFGFVCSWIFGREFSDRTIKNLLALPVSRSIIVLAKFLVMIFWCLLLSFIVMVVGLISGGIVDIPGWSFHVFFEGLNMLIVTSILTIVLSIPVAFFASYGRGFLSSLGYVISTMVISQFVAALGHGAYFPWAIPALYSGAAGSAAKAQLGIISFILVIITGLIGILATLLWWRFADHS